MTPLEILTEYFLGQIYGRYKRPPTIPCFETICAQTLLSSLIKQPGLPHCFASTVVAHFEALEKVGGRLICLGDPRYPTQVSHTSDPPLALNIIGNLSWLNHGNTVAMIGSRKAPADSLRTAFELGKAFANRGVVVVSGGAYGCDIAAHHGCLSSLQTPLGAVVVLAGGVEHLYPSANAEVFSDILDQGGTLVSERLCSYRPRHYDFPVRNRIIAGLAEALYVLSAGKKSGAMITARKALDYGRDVFVLMPRTNDARHDGMRELLFDGALGFESADGVLENNPVYF